MSAPRFVLAAGLALIPSVFAGQAQANELRRVFELRDASLANVVVAAYEAEGLMESRTARRALSLLARKFRAQHRSAEVHLFLYPRGAAPLALPTEAVTGSFQAQQWFRRDTASRGWRWSLSLDASNREAQFVDCDREADACHVLDD
ncbi:MAG: hypothetical protein JXQ91_00445 [Vannielia sp.]|uniref:hypothetical protein n=1 Tax=Rhodobacterales TaxID=204455 RepID=UPI002096247D|nr:hypothetical protein [Oceanicola sp. 502str15]MCO6382605.1 hypothetical protein [Oceanicola sp. 502str15]